MRIFLTGATGQIGRRVVVDRLARGDSVVLLSRNAAAAADRFAASVNRHVTVIEGDPCVPGDWQQAVDGCDAVIHLAGAPLAARRWNAEYTRTILNSRIDSTHQVANAIKMAQRPPSVVLSASAIGYYGRTGKMPATETSPAGKDFLAQVCDAWERQAMTMESAACRVVRLRLGVVIDRRGGALTKMLPFFRMFAGGPLGILPYTMSWIHWRDMVGIINVCLNRNDQLGPVNVVSPESVTNWQFASALGRAMRRPAFLPVSYPALRLVMGRMARHIVLNQHVEPVRMIAAQYAFRYADIDEAMIAEMRGTGDQNGDHKHGRATFGPLPASNGGAAMAHPNGAVAAGVSPTTPPNAASTPNTSSSVKAKDIRLVAIDIDGTLLRTDGALAAGVVKACREAIGQGCHLVLATARMPGSLMTVAQTIGARGPAIAAHGALIWNVAGNREDFHERLPINLVLEIVQTIRATEPGVLLAVEDADAWFSDQDVPKFQAEHAGLREPNAVGHIAAHVSDGASRLTVFGQPDQITRVRSVLEEQYWVQRRITLYHTHGTMLQIAHPLVDKGIALQRVAHALGVSRDQTMAIGDGHNDAGMIEWAGLGVAVANASETIRQLADAVVPTNDDLGVAHALQRYVLREAPVSNPNAAE